MRALDFALALNDIDQSLLQESLDRIYRVKRTASRRRLLKIALLAALLSALFIAAAYASGFFPLRNRIHSDEDLGRLIVPNGSEASAEYQAAVDWFGYRAEHSDARQDLSLSFARTPEERWISHIYFVTDREALDTLLDISREYGLSLYTDSIFVGSPEQLSALAGTGDFFGGRLDNTGGYVFADGSFKLEGSIYIDDSPLTFSLHRIYRGSIYPYNGYGQPRDFTQEEYLTALGFDVGVTVWEDGRRDISFSDGDVYINLSLDGANEALARRAADGIDFAALCTNNGKAGEILGIDRSPGANPEAAEAYEELYNSPEFQGSRDFTLWFRKVFYGSTFTGVYGQEGYEDIDAQMDMLREKYGLVPSVSKTEAERTEYSNGAWYENAGDYSLHYIPKGALYTRLEYFAPFREYSMVWSYDTAGGEQVYCACDGPEKRSCAHVLYVTDSAWVLLNMHTLDVWQIEQTADSIDWSEYK